jgi:hypothetical protein
MRNLFGARLVTCPETGSVAAVRFSRLHALLAMVRRHGSDAPLSHCSRWATRGPCEQPCVPQAKMPDAAVASLIDRWSVERRCVLCEKPLSNASLVGHYVSLRAGDGATTEWPDLAPETLPETLRARQPVCWNCHISETFRRRYPGLVVDR